MPTTRTATATAADRRASIPPGFHGVAALWICGMLALGQLAPVRYEALLQEDRFVEWWTAALFAAAAILRLRDAWPRRAPFDLLVAAFCLFVAGEEFSWGQRLLGITPPDAFLEHNTQQEITLHNFGQLFGQPKNILTLALTGYALLAPAGLLRRGRQLLGTAGATPPPMPVAPWLALSALLLVWYPADYTGEWVEALAGGLFLASTPNLRRAGVRSAATAAVAAMVLTLASARGRGADPERVSCAQREAAAIAADLQDAAALPELLVRSSVHKRLFTTIEQGYVDGAALRRFHAVRCADAGRSRRAYGVDPWGTAYWIETERAGRGQRSLVVYSMGANRRRDEEGGRPSGDDIASFGRLFQSNLRPARK